MCGITDRRHSRRDDELKLSSNALVGSNGTQGGNITNATTNATTTTDTNNSNTTTTPTTPTTDEDVQTQQTQEQQLQLPQPQTKTVQTQQTQEQQGHNHQQTLHRKEIQYQIALRRLARIHITGPQKNNRTIKPISRAGRRDC